MTELKIFSRASITVTQGRALVDAVYSDYHSSFKDVTISKEGELYIVRGSKYIRDFMPQGGRADEDDLKKYADSAFKDVKPWFGKPYKAFRSGWVTLRELLPMTFTCSQISIVE